MPGQVTDHDGLQGAVVGPGRILGVVGAARRVEPIDLKPLCDAIRTGEINAPTRADDTAILLGMTRPATLAELAEALELDLPVPAIEP